MKNKFIIGVFSIILLVIFIVAGCTPSTPPSTTAPTQAQPTAAAQPIELKMAISMPPVHWAAKSLDQWSKKVNESTKGQVKITIFPAETLGKLPDEWNMLKTGISDLGLIIATMYSADFPLFGVCDQPFVMPEGRDLTFLDALFNKYLVAQFKDAKLLWPVYMAPMSIHTVKKPISVLEDLKGLQISAPRGTSSEIVKALGATPVTVSTAEVYSALEKGMIDGCMSGTDQFAMLKRYEVAKCSNFTSLTNGMGGVVMNLASWNKLSPENQKIIEGLNPWAEKLQADAGLAVDAEVVSTVKAAGNTITSLTPSELKRWEDVTKPVVDKWIADMNAKGLPGTAMVKDILTLKAQIKK